MKLYKYQASDVTADYRPSVEIHEKESRVKLIKMERENNIIYVYLTDEEASNYNDIELVPQEEIIELGDIVKYNIPEKISKRQMRQQLIIDGLYTNVQNVIDSIEDETERLLTQVFWEDSTEFERNHPMLIQFAASLGLDSNEIDMLFVKANKL